MNWFQKRVYTDEEREIMAEIEEYEDYAGQQNEVDARYTGEYARSQISDQRKQEYAEKIEELKDSIEDRIRYIKNLTRTKINEVSGAAFGM